MDWNLVGAIVGTAIGSTAVAAAVTGFVTWKVSKATIAVQGSSLDQQRLTQNLTVMIDLMALGHGRDPRGIRPAIGHGEVVGAIESVATLGAAYPPLEPSARAYLTALRDLYSPGATPLTTGPAAIITNTWKAASGAIQRLPNE